MHAGTKKPAEIIWINNQVGLFFFKGRVPAKVLKCHYDTTSLDDLSMHKCAYHQRTLL